jgi:two-component system sensor histidine kinase CpxA
MRSLFAKTLLWFLATCTVAIGGIILSTALSVGSPEGRGPFGMLLSVQVAEAKRAYETGGRDALSQVLSKFQQITEQKVIFTDAKGVDLLTGQQHPELIRRPQRSRVRLPFPFNTGRPPVIARSDPARQYWLFLINQNPNFRFYFFQPQHLWIVGLVVLLCYAFAYHLTSPVRRLRGVVDNFGRGDLSARSEVNRKDELGQLAKSFNLMADRIQTLLSAERRLLLDISHELRSPLARLGVAIELARSGEDRGHMLDRIQKEADRINELVAELLQVTRVEGDPTALRNMTVRLDELLADLVYDSLLEAKAKDCTLLLEAPLSVTLNGDEELIRRAIENVIRNAIRYAPRGTAVQIELKKVGRIAEISVRDQGPGVPEEELPRIFDAFYRVDSDRNRSSGGLGLGLAIARRAVELHNGRLSARNANPGLLVTIEFPIAVESPAAATSLAGRPTAVSTS